MEFSYQSAIIILVKGMTPKVQTRDTHIDKGKWIRTQHKVDVVHDSQSAKVRS